MLILFYIYAQLGLIFFGGAITTDIEVADYVGLDQNYVYLNFNDFPNAFIFVFHLLIVNNYNYTVIFFSWLT